MEDVPTTPAFPMVRHPLAGGGMSFPHHAFWLSNNIQI